MTPPRVTQNLTSNSSPLSKFRGINGVIVGGPIRVKRLGGNQPVKIKPAGKPLVQNRQPVANFQTDSIAKIEENDDSYKDLNIEKLSDENPKDDVENTSSNSSNFYFKIS